MDGAHAQKCTHGGTLPFSTHHKYFALSTHVIIFFCREHSKKRPPATHCRFVRDHFHYRNFIFCTVAAALRSLDDSSHVKGSDGGGGTSGRGANESKGSVATAARTNRAGQRGFSTMHIRRGDFQYKQVTPMKQLIQESRTARLNTIDLHTHARTPLLVGENESGRHSGHDAGPVLAGGAHLHQHRRKRQGARACVSGLIAFILVLFNLECGLW